MIFKRTKIAARNDLDKARLVDPRSGRLMVAVRRGVDFAVFAGPDGFVQHVIAHPQDGRLYAVSDTGEGTLWIPLDIHVRTHNLIFRRDLPQKRYPYATEQSLEIGSFVKDGNEPNGLRPSAILGHILRMTKSLGSFRN